MKRLWIVLLILPFVGCVTGYDYKVTPEERVEAWRQLCSEYYHTQGIRQFQDMEGLE